MSWITWLMVAIIILWQIIKIILEQTMLESRTAYTLDWVISSMIVFLHHGLILYLDVADGIALISSLGIVLWCFATSMSANFIGLQMLGLTDEQTQLEPCFILAMTFLLFAVFIPIGGTRLIGFPNLFQNCHYLWMVALVGEIILLILHFWLNYEWDWVQSGMISHWVLSTVLLLGLFAWAYSITNDRSLAWLMALILGLLLHLTRVSGLLLGKLLAELFAIDTKWYIQEWILFLCQTLGISIIYIAPLLLTWIHKLF